MTITRRECSAGLAAAGLALPSIVPSAVWGAKKKPSDRLTAGFIGMGKQSRGLLGAFMHREQVVAVCDVDTTRREDARKRVDKHYKKKVCKGCNDFRELVGRDDIDAVCIQTPDHWHALPTLAALKSGKDVYCEKPLTHNIQEAIDIIAAVDANGRVLQTGSMQRSMREFRVAAELVRNGVIGKVDHVVCSFGGPPKPCNLPAEKMEPGLDWNLWCGPAPLRPYNSVLSPRGIHNHFPRWRNYKEYGGGGVCDWGAHHLDIAQWGLGMDDSGPVGVRPPAKAGSGRGGALVYDNGVTVKHEGGFGVHFTGADGEVMVHRGQFKFIHKGKVIAEHTRKKKKGTSCRSECVKAEKAFLKDPKVKLYRSQSHVDDFLQAVRKRTKPITNEQVGGRTAICCHLLNLVYFHNRTITWDPAKLAFAGGTGTPAWLTRQNPRDWKKA